MCVNPRIDTGSNLNAPLTSLSRNSTGMVGYLLFQYNTRLITFACLGTRTRGCVVGSMRSLISIRGSDIYLTLIPSFFVTSFCVTYAKRDSVSSPTKCSHLTLNSIMRPFTKSPHRSAQVRDGLSATLEYGSCGWPWVLPQMWPTHEQIRITQVAL